MKKLGIFSIVLACGLGSMLALSFLNNSRITCHIANAGTVKVTGVTVDVSGNRFFMGTLEPGEVKSVALRPLNQAGGVQLIFDKADGTLANPCLEGYIESEHYKGEIHVEIGTDGSVRVVSNTVRTRLF